ncbi:MAG TPA: glycerophosphodiester phosphodiesterase, partial [Bryobacteraceae bacterium]|nr:glycerophosphodiester phosphodiesterase [Bryobacteraceae bacterium]
AAAATLLAVCAPASAQNMTGRWRTLDGKRPLVIGHRGASGYLPEHTIEAYTRAIEQGADYIEPDLVSTKDGHLVARHEPVLDDTTDVGSIAEFAGRKTTRLLDGIKTTGFFASDFTLAEIRRLRARQPRADRPQEFNGRFAIPTLEEVIELAQRESARRGRTIGIYPETKHPTFHFVNGVPLEDKLLQVLERYGWNHRNAPVFIQSFEVANLKYLRSRSAVRLVQLIDANDVALDGTLTYAAPYDKPYDFAVSGDPRGFGDLVKPAGLADIATYADGIGPWKRYVVGVRGADTNADGKADDVNADGTVNDADKSAVVTTLVQDAHRAGLFVHTWTFRSETATLAADYQGDPRREYSQFYAMGVDGVFSDFPDTAFAARQSVEFVLP